MRTQPIDISIWINRIRFVAIEIRFKAASLIPNKDRTLYLMVALAEAPTTRDLKPLKLLNARTLEMTFIEVIVICVNVQEFRLKLPNQRYASPSI